MAAAEKIGGQVLDVSTVIGEAFSLQKELLVKAKSTKKPDTVGLMEFIKLLNEVMVKAYALTEGRRSEFFHHLKTGADSLGALAWIAYTGKDSGMSLPIAHVEESWQTAEFYSNKILMEYRNKDANHVEWAKALKELYIRVLMYYVKFHYPLGTVWSATGKTAVSAPTKASGFWHVSPRPPPASLFSSEMTQASSSAPKVGMSAVFHDINSGKLATFGLGKISAEMETKNRTDKTGVDSISEKEGRADSPSFSKLGPLKLELQIGRKWVVENQIGKNNLVIDYCDAKQSVYVSLGARSPFFRFKVK